MHTTTITRDKYIQIEESREEPMEILWGAWIKQTKYNVAHRSFDILGIYENIWKKGKNDFPFITDLNIILAFRVLERGEVGQI